MGTLLSCGGSDYAIAGYVLDTNLTPERLPTSRIKWRWDGIGINWTSPQQAVDGRMRYSTSSFCKINGVQCTQQGIKDKYTSLAGISLFSYTDSGGMTVSGNFYYGFFTDDLGQPTYAVSSKLDLALMCIGVNEPVPTPTPTITPTPTQVSGYCGSVQDENSNGGGGGAGFGDGENFQIPGFEIGDTTCVNIGGWTLNLGFLVSILNSVNITIPETFGLPGIEICFIPITVTPIVLFGIEIDLGIVLMVSAAVFVIRKLTRG